MVETWEQMVTKLDFVTITQAVDLDTVETDTRIK